MSPRNVKICTLYLLNNSYKVTYSQQAVGTAAVDIPTVSVPATPSHAITPRIVARSACGIGHLRLRMNENWKNNVVLQTIQLTSHTNCKLN
jgi:hypothetical protein